MANTPSPNFSYWWYAGIYSGPFYYARYHILTLGWRKTTPQRPFARQPHHTPVLTRVAARQRNVVDDRTFYLCFALCGGERRVGRTRAAACAPGISKQTPLWLWAWGLYRGGRHLAGGRMIAQFLVLSSASGRRDGRKISGRRKEWYNARWREKLPSVPYRHVCLLALHGGSLLPFIWHVY